MEVGIIILAAVSVGLLVMLASVNAALRRDVARQAGQLEMMNNSLECNRQMQEALKDSLSKNMQSGQESVSKSLQSNLETIGDLKRQIGVLHGTNQQMIQLGTDVKRLQHILASPKMRGQLGEWSLENLLGNILPAGTFELQYEFADGKKVDALIKMPEYSVPVDAKFPLPGFEAMASTENVGELAKLRRAFQRDVKAHIDKIASQYIRPNEGTLDFALMYIPAENVYYETVIRQKGDTVDILEYALSKKVIPVSPNVCYAYLMTIVMGLHGLQIEKQAAEIRQGLSTLRGKFSDFVLTWELMGKHLRNTNAQYQQGQSQLDKFDLELDRISETDVEAVN